MNFDWFRRYYNGMIKKAGKRVAHLNISKKTSEFLSYISRRIEPLKKIKKEIFLHEIINNESFKLQNFKDVLRENLYKCTELRMDEKSVIVKIIQKDKLNEINKEELISMLIKLPTENLISLLGKDFEKHVQNNIRCDWDYDSGMKKIMLIKYFKIMKKVDETISNNKINTSNKKLNIKIMQKIANERGGVCLSTEYINNSTIMEYECNCENDDCKICFASFKSGSRCNECALEKRKQTMLKKYGTSSSFSINGGYSKESQKLFDIIYQKIDKKHKDKINARRREYRKKDNKKYYESVLKYKKENPTKIPRRDKIY
ncbi:hypothetical protein LCGC14_0765470, partial [marine sediment metagenome]